MTQYSNVEQYGNKLLVRLAGQPDQKVSFAPTLFVHSEKESEWKNLHGATVSPVKFADLNDAKEFVKQYDGVDNFAFYGNTDYKYQWIAENYRGTIDWSFDKLKTVVIDIEVAAENGFPDISQANEAVILITVKNLQNNHITTWGFRPVNGLTTEYRCFKDEASMLKDFVLWFATMKPDILSGWNSEGFDVPYLINRINNVHGEVAVKAMSPWGLVLEREVEMMGKKVIMKNLVGIAQLDFMDLYKKFVLEKKETYALDFIAQEELGDKKIPHEGTFREFYTNDWDTFVLYNIQDVELVVRLEQKLMLIQLVCSMAYMTKSNFQDIFSPVKTWDNFIHAYLFEQKVAIPQHRYMEKRHIQGAYVMDPIRKKQENVVSFDLDSLYPNIIIALNISPEKYVTTTEFSIPDYLKNPQPTNDQYSVGANGSRFMKDSAGVIPSIMKEVYDRRKSVKQEMNEKKRELSKLQ